MPRLTIYRFPIQGLLVLAVLAASTAGARASSEAAPCDTPTVMTLLATDTNSDRSLFALSTADRNSPTWLLAVDSKAGTAHLFPDVLAGLRTGASHGPGAFLTASRCGAGCYQPVRWRNGDWRPLGEAVHGPDAASVHLTYDRSGAPWLVLHTLSVHPGATRLNAYRWDGERWLDRGALTVQAIGSPGARPDPSHQRAILVGSGRFAADAVPAYWLSALPAPSDSPGGQVTAVSGAAVFLTFDSRFYSTVDGGSSWLSSSWTPWSAPVARRSTGASPAGYWIDLPPAATGEELAALWYNESDPSAPTVTLTLWQPDSDGRSHGSWQPLATLDLATSDSPTVEHVLRGSDGRWTLLGHCRFDGESTVIGAQIWEPTRGAFRSLEIPLTTGW